MNLEYHQPQRAIKTIYRELIWAKFLAPGKLRKLKIDLLHSPGAVLISPPRTIPHVATLHDLAVLRYPERFRPWHRWSSKRQFLRVLTADRVICISRFTAEEAMRLIGLPASRIEVIYNGCDFHREETTGEEQKPSFSLPAEFFLFVGSLEPGKNLSLLRCVYHLASERKIHLPPLLIVGARWEGVGSEGPASENWQYLGHQPDEVLLYLYCRALALVFPSKYEGFGLPVGEAMAAGCPVICSPVSSLPEVGGEAVCFSAMEPEAYLKSMHRLVRDSTWRSELTQLGFEQAKKFSWKKCAAATLSVYREVLKT
jgi:glycosyltransferase involved in cell wall biosynthesis